MVNERIEFKNLEYIVMEGGGARGATYLGAIRAMEENMIDRFFEDEAIFVHTERNPYPALLDFYRLDNSGNKVPVIKGIAGSSAGAITTFGIALGFSSKEVDTVLQFPFQRFLDENDAGKYRMVDKDGELAIGQDKKHRFPKNVELHFDKKFEYDFSRDSTRVGNNLYKFAKRNLTATLIIKILADGVGSQFQQIENVQKKIDAKTDDIFLDELRYFSKFFLRTRNNFFQKWGWAKLLNLFLFKVFLPIKFKLPMKLDADNVANLLIDRGMYSGFQIREFFMDMMIFAATRETHFHRGVLEWYKKKLKLTENQKEEIKKEILAATDFEIGKRSKSKFQKEIILNFFQEISTINFRDFNEITGINFGMCVANLSTGNPMYFGHEWTPDFRVLEAVAGSMSIPPAIKPLYNEADVVKTNHGERPAFVKSDGSFELHDFYKWQHIVKKGLQQLIYDDDKTKGTIVDLNNEIDISAFLPKLRDVVNGEYKTDTATGLVTMDSPKTERKTKVIYQGNEYTIDYNTYLFFFNATYKGLFIDGGYRNNIPFNFFRLRNDNIDRLVAIKIDDHFPPELLERVYEKIKMKLAHLDIEEFFFSEFTSPGNIADDGLDEFLSQFETTKHKVTKKEIILETRIAFEEYMQKAWKNLTEEEKSKTDYWEVQKQMAVDPKAMKRLTKETLKAYKKKHLTAPWKQPVSITATALDGYAYGNEKGQVRSITDHNHILPLYDCGVSTFDFDMKAVLPMIKMAQAQAFLHTNDFFKPGNDL